MKVNVRMLYHSKAKLLHWSPFWALSLLFLKRVRPIALSPIMSLGSCSPPAALVTGQDAEIGLSTLWPGPFQKDWQFYKTYLSHPIATQECHTSHQSTSQRLESSVWMRAVHTQPHWTAPPALWHCQGRPLRGDSPPGLLSAFLALLPISCG